MEDSIVRNALDIIEQSLSSDIFNNAENEALELKDLSTGTEWQSLKETICAFLNSHPGIIITGIRERNNKYHYTGYNENNLQNYLELRNKVFFDDSGKLLDLSEYIGFEIKDFLDKKIKIIKVQPVSDDIRFVFFNGQAYERKSTADVKVSRERIEAHKQYKAEELPFRKEILPVEGATIDDLDINKLNDYIQLLNKEIRIQNLFAENDIKGAEIFLSKKHFVKEDYVTTLGMLVCGKDPTHYLEFRSEVDCFVYSPAVVAINKKVLTGTVIHLMEESYRFVINNIQVGVGIDKSGSKVFEYPERVIRESLNNALAHRDYKDNKNVDISIRPNKEIEIRNPGKFKDKLIIDINNRGVLVKRIIPGNPSTQNPKLASILKVFDKWEGKGFGMASLLNVCLENKIDLPYYKINVNDISLVIPKGKLLDEKMEFWLRSYGNYIKKKLGSDISEQQKVVLAYLYKSEILNQQYRFTILLTTDNDYFGTINTLLNAGLIYISDQIHNLYPIYFVNKDLAKSNFYDELFELFGKDFEFLSNYYKKALNIIYRYSKFNKEAVTAKAVADELYLEENQDDKTKYTTFVRKISGYCSRMSSNGKKFLIKGRGYSINFDYTFKETLFD